MAGVCEDTDVREGRESEGKLEAKCAWKCERGVAAGLLCSLQQKSARKKSIRWRPFLPRALDVTSHGARGALHKGGASHRATVRAHSSPSPLLLHRRTAMAEPKAKEVSSSSAAAHRTVTRPPEIHARGSRQRCRSSEERRGRITKRGVNQELVDRDRVQHQAPRSED